MFKENELLEDITNAQLMQFINAIEYIMDSELYNRKELREILKERFYDDNKTYLK